MATMDSSKMYKLIILAGQSNALGQSTARANLTGDYVNFAGEISAVRLATQLQCNSDSGAAACARETPAAWMKDRLNSQGNFGAELGIAKAIPNILSHAATGNVVISKHGTGATDLANDWKHDAVSGYVLYSRMKAFIEDPAQLWAASYEVVGCIWMQGESDAAVEVEANAYETNLTALVSQMRTDFRADLPFVISRLHADDDGTYKATVQAAEDAVAAADANVVVVTPTPGLSVDNSHYTDDGYCELGETDLGPALDAFYTLIS